MPKPHALLAEPTRDGLPHGLTPCCACNSTDLGWSSSARIHPVDEAHPSPRVSVTAALHCNGCGVDVRIVPLYDLLASLGSWVPKVMRPKAPPIQAPPLPPPPAPQAAQSAPIRETSPA